MKKIISVIGIIASLLAAEGLHRFGSFIGAMKGGDTPFYMGILLVSLVVAMFFVLSMVGKLAKIAKWLGVLLLIASIVLMGFAPMLPVNVQIFVSLGVALLCMIFAPTTTVKEAGKDETSEQTNADETPQKAPSKFGKIFKRIALIVVILLIALAILGRIAPKKVTEKSQQPTQTQTVTR